MGRSDAAALPTLLTGGRPCDTKKLAAAAVAKPAITVTQGQFLASDGARIGFVQRAWPRQRHNDGPGLTLLLVPGLSATAAAFSEWFEPLAQLPQVDRTVSLDIRGYGSSTGSWTPSAPPGGKDAPGYGGLTTWRLARDLEELQQHLGVTRAVLLGHSLGVHVVLQHLQLHGTGVAGLILLDQSLRNMAVGAGPVDETFPTELATFKPEQLEAWIPRFVEFDANATVDVGSAAGSRDELEVAPQPYSGLRRALLEQFHAADEPGAGRCMTQTSRGLLAWMRSAGATNGKVFARLMTSSMFEDMTGMAAVVRDAGLPVFWYGGERSLVPLRAVEWSARAMAGAAAERFSALECGSVTNFVREEAPESVLLTFRGTAGNHCPWLNEDGSAEVFMQALGDFLASL